MHPTPTADEPAGAAAPPTAAPRHAGRVDPDPAIADEPADAAARLAAERARTVARVAGLAREFDAIVEAAAGANVDDEHDPEGATIAFERQQVGTLLTAARDHLADLDRALDRLRAGEYGTCTRCGRPIAAARLLARPTATTCVAC